MFLQCIYLFMYLIYLFIYYLGIRLQGGNSTSGRVEIAVNDAWGTVCDDQFDSNNNAAKVVCRSLSKPWYLCIFCQ